MSAPAAARPAATLVLLRDGADELEVLVLRRNRAAAFAPGAWVFPGGLVDVADAAPIMLGRVDGLTASAAEERLGLVHADPPALAYYVAAIREAFEETAILLPSEGFRDAAHHVLGQGRDATVDRVGELREALLAGRASFADVLARIGARVAAGALVYFAHWITPERSPRRYDTRFFAARAAVGAAAVIDGREMIEARWVTPSRALSEHRAGDLPMILPTIRTLERLATYPDPSAALAALALEPVPTIMPTAETGGFAGPGPPPRLRS